MALEEYSDSSSFYDTLLELWALEEYISILEVELPSMIEKERDRLRQNLKDGDEQEVYHTEIAEYQLDQGITTRIITGSALIATWATFESVIQRAAGMLEQPAEKKIEKKAKRLFDKLGIQYSSQIKDLYALRNALAHTNGRVDDIGLGYNDQIRLEKKQRMEQLANSSSGLKISHDGYLIVSIEFVRGVFGFIEPLLLDLAKRADQELTQKQRG